MTRTMVRDLMFWKGRVNGVPWGVVTACADSESMEERGRGGIEEWEQ